MKHSVKFNYLGKEYTAIIFNNPVHTGKFITDKFYICSADGYDIYNRLNRKDIGYENTFIAVKHGDITGDLSEIYRNKYEMINGIIEDQSELHFCVDEFFNSDMFDVFCDSVEDRTGYRFDRTYYREIGDSIFCYAIFTK